MDNGGVEIGNGGITETYAKQIFTIESVRQGLHADSTVKPLDGKNNMKENLFSATNSVPLLKPLTTTRIDVSRLVTATAQPSINTEFTKYKYSSPNIHASGEGWKLSKVSFIQVNSKVNMTGGWRYL